jgi:hypothetical protein
MKIALCFIISYEHKLNKEHIWIDWIENNKDIINVYIHYKDKSKIKSEWILKHCIPEKYKMETSYYHVVPAYMTLLNYAINSSSDNKWFCFLTDSCIPVINPNKFRDLFFNYNNFSIMKWKPVWWDINYHKRANLKFLPSHLRLGHDPWFILNNYHAKCCIQFMFNNSKEFDFICKGGLANESIFAIILKKMNLLEKGVVNESTTITDWSKMSSPTSPYVFKHGSIIELKFITEFIEKNKFSMFMRKVDPFFPDDIILEFLNKPYISNMYNNYFYYYLNIFIIFLLSYIFLQWLLL